MLHRLLHLDSDTVWRWRYALSLSHRSVQRVREVRPGSYGEWERSPKAPIDLHQNGSFVIRIPAELDHRDPFPVNVPEERNGLLQQRWIQRYAPTVHAGAAGDRQFVNSLVLKCACDLSAAHAQLDAQ